MTKAENAARVYIHNLLQNKQVKILALLTVHIRQTIGRDAYSLSFWCAKK